MSCHRTKWQETSRKEMAGNGQTPASAILNRWSLHAMIFFFVYLNLSIDILICVGFFPGCHKASDSCTMHVHELCCVCVRETVFIRLLWSIGLNRYSIGYLMVSFTMSLAGNLTQSTKTHSFYIRHYPTTHMTQMSKCIYFLKIWLIWTYEPDRPDRLS